MKKGKIKFPLAKSNGENGDPTVAISRDNSLDGSIEDQMEKTIYAM